MELYEYLIGGKKTGRIEDLKDAIPDSKPFRDIKKDETFFVSHFKPDGTCTYAYELKISSIHKKPTYWTFSGLAGNGERFDHFMWLEDLNKKLVVRDQSVYYTVFSTFKMDAEPLFKLVKKEIENSKK